VTRQTGRWYLGFVRPPLSDDYGLVLDMATDGCVLSNHGGVYRTQSDALMNEMLERKDLTMADLPRLHRLAITKRCERQAGCPPAPASAAASQGGGLAFGSDSIVILELDHSQPSRTDTQGEGQGGGESGLQGEGGQDQAAEAAAAGGLATARFYLVQSLLLGRGRDGGPAFTGPSSIWGGMGNEELGVISACALRRRDPCLVTRTCVRAS